MTTVPPICDTWKNRGATYAVLLNFFVGNSDHNMSSLFCGDVVDDDDDVLMS